MKKHTAETGGSGVRGGGGGGRRVVEHVVCETRQREGGQCLNVTTFLFAVNYGTRTGVLAL